MSKKAVIGSRKLASLQATTTHSALAERLDNTTIIARAEKLKLRLDYDRAVISGDEARKKQLAKMLAES